MKKVVIILGIAAFLSSCSAINSLYIDNPCNPNKQFKGKDRSTSDKRNHA